MKTYTFDEHGRLHGMALRLSLWPRAAWGFAFIFLFAAAGLRAQSFTPVISQIIPAEDNSSYYDHESSLPTVIFIKNNGTVAGTISGFFLTDSTAVANKWRIPNLTAQGAPLILKAGETMGLFASGKNRTTTPLATNFLLPCGATGYLYNPQLSLTSQKDVAGESCPECIDLITPKSISAWIVPTSTNPAATSGDWRLPAFTAGQWNRGTPCLGYDREPLKDGMILYSVFDTNTVDTLNRVIFDQTDPVQHNGSWPALSTGASAVSVPNATLPKVIENIGFAGTQIQQSYVQYSHHAELDPSTASGAGDYTWSVWINPLTKSLTGSEVIFRKGADPATDPNKIAAGYLLTRTSTNNLSMMLQMPGFNVTATTTTGAILPDRWHHVLATFTRGPAIDNLSIYHNGVLRASVEKERMVVATSQPMYLARGIERGPINFTGRMDDFATWNRGLSTDEIGLVYGIGNSGRRIDGVGVATDLITVNNCITTAGSATVTGPVGSTVSLFPGQWISGESLAGNARVVSIVNGSTFIITPPASSTKKEVTLTCWGGRQLFAPCNPIDVGAAMRGVNTSLYERIAFTAPSAALIRSMTLRVKYEDGFIAYINGVEIARRNASTPAPVWNMAADSDRPDYNALLLESIPVPPAGISALTAGTNILAIHALNATSNDPRFLICPELCYDALGPDDCVVSTNGKYFWITFPGNAPEDTTTPLELSVCITGAAGTTGNVSVAGLTPPFSQNFSLPANGRVTVVLPKAASLEKSDLVENKGVRIFATQNVAVTGRTRIDYSTDTFIAHPIDCLGSSYLTLCWQNSWTGLPELNGTQFGIVATANNTNVTIKPKVATNGHPAGMPYNFVLNAGQTYMLRNVTDSPADLSGTEITSDSPIAVFGGHRCANVSGKLFFCDTVLEQNLPLSLWSTEYVAAMLVTRTNSELIRVVAGENDTTISINGVAQALPLNKGDSRDYNVTGGAVVTSNNKKFLAAHMSRSSDSDAVDSSDPFQLNCQPTSSWLSGYRFCTPLAAEFTANYANVLAKNDEIAGVNFNPAPVAFGPVIPIGGTSYSYRQVTLAPATVYTTSSPLQYSSGRNHGIEIYGWDEFDSYGHSGGMSFTDTMPPIIAQCPPDMTLYTVRVAGAAERATMPDLKSKLRITDACCSSDRVVVVQTPSPGTLLALGQYDGTVRATDCNQNTVTCAFTVYVRSDPRQQAFAQFGNQQTEATSWGWTADPDGDGITNEQEYLLGTSMTTRSSMHEALTFEDGGLNASSDVVLRVRDDDPGLDYSLEGSHDLEGWFGGYGYFREVSSAPSSLPGYKIVTLRPTESSGARRFFGRLQVRRN